MTEEDPITERLEWQKLLDVYGPALTERQREACILHFDEDWSLAEIADYYGVTRSGAHDLLRRATMQLELMEEQLGHAKKFAELELQTMELKGRLEKLQLKPKQKSGSVPRSEL